ncbi:MAG: PstS family phosphate ABC transporter substrate-binding protein [Bacteroidales bacterium]|jgi:phosphate transport system substrate-binding protein|nr:PstS family phosphate ABC transporter substrate-binding protein [Bacteroidales bacterium]
MMKNTNFFLLAILGIILATAISCKNNPGQDKPATETTKEQTLSGTITISGAFALYPITARWAEEFQKIHPRVRIDISAGGAGKGMTDALSGMVDLGMFSRGITEVEKAKGVWWIAVTQDAVLPTMNARSPYAENIHKQGFTSRDFEEIFIQNKIRNWKKWAEGTPAKDLSMNVYTRSDACGAAQMWAEFLGRNQEDLVGTGIYGDPGMADAVKNDVQGIGYNNVIYVYDIKTRKKHPGLEVIPIDLNENGKIDPQESFYNKLDDITRAIQTGKYPAPPARDLYFVAKGKPQKKVILEFLRWIVTDGQEYVQEAGYVKLSDLKLKNEYQKLNP